ncbi:MAG: hypothetical protein ACPG6B_09230, partial [Oceanihabitans sp.]
MQKICEGILILLFNRIVLMKKNALLILFFITSICSLFAQQPNDCVNATAICGNIDFTYNPTGPGTDDFLNNPNPDCLPNDPVESQSVWLSITIATAGSLEFTLTPNNGTDDYDWAIYGPNVTCANFGNAIRCSSTMFLGDGTTGLGNGTTDTTEGPGTGDGFLAPLNVAVGEEYFIFINNWSSSSSGFDLTFGGSATFNPPPTVDSTPLDLALCDNDGVIDGQQTFDLTSNEALILGAQTGLNISYHTNNGDAQVGINPIANPSTFNNVTTVQTIYVRITNPTTGCFEVTSFDIEVLSQPVIGNTPNNLEVCDADNDGFVEFDLSQNDAIVQNGQANTIVTYYNNLADAQAGTNNLPLLYTNATAFTQETIWLRIENTVSGCFETSSFTITPFQSAIANPVANQFICDDNNDGFWSFDLAALEATVLGAQNSSDFAVTFHNTQADADANSNSIASPYTNQTAYTAETIFVRIENNLNTNCFDTSSFNINVFDMPSTIEQTYSLCDNADDGYDTNGFVEFDLSTLNAQILGTQNPAQFNISFHIDQADADNNNSPLPFLYTNTTANMQDIIVRLENADPNGTFCYVTNTIHLIVNQLPQVLPLAELRQCDDDTNDGFVDFNLTEANSILSTNFANETFTYYLTQAEAESGINPILNPTTYTNTDPSAAPDILFVRIESTEGCYRTAQLNLIVSTTQIPVGFMLNYEECDNDLIDGDDNNGIATFDFSNASAQITALFPPGQILTITYYQNLADALAETNQIPDISNHRNDASPYVQNIVVRIDSDVDNACLGLGEHIQLTVNPLPENNTVNNAMVCSNDPNSASVDLSIFNPEVLGAQNAADFSISYHETQAETDANTNALPTPYTITSSPQALFVRIENNNTNCVRTTINFNVVINTNPIVTPPTPLTVCDDSVIDGFTAIDLSIKDEEISGS